MLKICNLRKVYRVGDNNIVALDDVSLELRQSEFVCILGPSGCGKTTFLNILGGLDRYSSGDIIINGVSTKKYKDRDWDTYRNHKIGFVFQSYNLIPHLTVAENVEMALTIAGLKKKERRRMARVALEEVGLLDQENKLPNQMSGGQMQRVAIARALVNNPEIILADEPTGALDSVTSVQIMDLLREVAKKRLVIMVTHNKELADEYATRIISLFDGKKVGDSNPYKSRKKPVGEVAVVKKAKMSFWTALYLSFKNLLTKKGRTFMTAFAGSIGIIGIALVLAVNNGFTGYINNMQTDALSSNPISVSAISMNYDSFNSFGENQTGEPSDIDYVLPYNPAQQFIKFGHYNYIGDDFINEINTFQQNDVRKNQEDRDLNALKINYFTPLKVVTKVTDANSYMFYQSQNKTSILTGQTNDTFYEGFANKEFVLSQYDIVYGNYPEKHNGDVAPLEMALVVGKGNKISYTTLNALSIPTPIIDGQFPNIDYEDICNKEMKVVFNDDYYVPNASTFEDISTFTKKDVTDQTVLKGMYESVNALTVKISCILRMKDDVDSGVLSNGVMYLPELGEYYRENCKQSLIARKQIANKSSGEFYDNFVVGVSEMAGILDPNGYASVTAINSFLKLSFGFELASDEAFEMGLQQIGVSKLPTSVFFYANDFDSKENIKSLINNFNESEKGEVHKIIFSDSSEFLSSTLGQMVNIVSYVLVVFAGISLVVSSIMIGIISYVSVIERTKEIGVLRSLGARKKDVSNVFNAETSIIGFASGFIGIGVTYLLSLPINLIVESVSGNTVKNIAMLNPVHALILVALSISLTLIAGLIPSSIAAKRDPVVALRSE